MGDHEQIVETFPKIEARENPVPIHHSSFNIRHWLKWLWRIAVVLAVVPILQVAILRFINPPVSTMMLSQMVGHIFCG